MCKKEPFWAKNNEDRWLQLNFNINFLKKIKESNDTLHCEYCGKQNLKIYEWCEKTNLHDVATVDHFLPKSRYEELKTNETNLLVACYNCNSRKKNDIWDVSSVKYPIFNDRISHLNKVINGINIDIPS